MSYHIHIGDHTISLTVKDLEKFDIHSSSEDKFHILHDHQSVQAKLIKADWQEKQLTIEINGNRYDLHIEDEYEQLIHKMGMEVGGDQKVENIHAPMPGLILDILVSPGQSVAQGDPILILEAMKMENVLKAAGEGIIQSIAVEKGNAVDKGQLLIEIS